MIQGPPPPRPDLGFPGPTMNPVLGAEVTTDENGRPLATWPWWEAVLVTLIGFVLGTFASLPVFLLLGVTTSANGANGVSELAQGVVVDGVVLATLIYWLRRRHPSWKKIIGFPTRAALPKEVVIGGLLGIGVRIAAGIASAIVLSLLGSLTGREVSIPEQVTSDLKPAAFVLFALYAVVVAPITEEFVFRGLLYRSIRDRRGVALGAIVSALAFGLVHFVPGGTWEGVLALQLTMVITGIGLALIYERRKNLVADIAGHAAFNLIAVVAVAAGFGVVPGWR
jgi:membrane protease YdiL (CAAX protease family)